MVNGVIIGNKIIGGPPNTMESWTQGLSAYDLACRYQGFKGTLYEYLDSLKGISPVFSEPVVDEETGNITFTMTDIEGEHEITLHDGNKIDDGTITFAKLADSVQNKINSIDTVKDELLGNSNTDTVESKTIEGLVKKTNLTSNTLANLDSYVGTIPNDSTATSVIEYVNTVKDKVDTLNEYLVWHRFDEI